MKLNISFVVGCAGVLALSACDNTDTFMGPNYICDVTNPVQTLTLDPSTSVLFVHSPARATDVAQLTARATNRNGGTRTDVPIKLVSSDTTVATVDSTGLVKALKPGAVQITASTCGVKATSKITVSLLTVSVSVKADTTLLVAGDSVAVRARATAQDGSAIPAARFVFSSSPATGVTIVQKSDSTAIVKTSAAGTFVITATGEGASGSTGLQVSPRIFVGATISNQFGMDVGKDSGCGLLPLGRLYCWGLNGSGQLGAQTDSVCFEEGVIQPPSFPCSVNPVRAGRTLSFGSVSAGDGATCAIVTGGSLYCWGNGADGKLGNGRLGGVNTPAPVTSGLSFTSVSVGGNHACGLVTGGGAYCWGSDSVGQLGDARNVNSTTPIPVSGGGGTLILASISAGYRHTCGLQSDGTALCWGSRMNAQLGDGIQDSDGSTTPVAVVGGLKFIAISAGGDTIQRVPGELLLHFESHTCAIAVGGAAYCWGSNAYGELGNGSVGGVGSVSAVPVPVAGGLVFSQISSGGTHTCALTAAGAAYCWGHNKDLQLGLGGYTGSGVDSGTPQLVTGGELPSGVTFSSISAGSRHTCGLASDGAIYCWGSDVFGALGNTFQAAFRGLPQRVATPK